MHYLVFIFIERLKYFTVPPQETHSEKRLIKLVTRICFHNGSDMGVFFFLPLSCKEGSKAPMKTKFGMNII